MILLYNAKIYTLDPEHPTATAIAIDGARILAIGDDQTILSEYGGRSPKGKSRVQIQDVSERAIIPGLTDAHIHLETYALGLQKVDCETPSKSECLRRVAERAARTPPGEWVLGHGWNQNDWLEGFGTATDLDMIVPKHPVYLTAKSLHAAWVNSAAMRLAGLTPDTPNPPGGRLGRGSDGNLNGILFDSAMKLVEDRLPQPSIEQVAQAIREAQPILLSMGLTGIHDFDRRRCLAALQKLHAENVLQLRVVKSLHLEDLPHAITLGLRTGFGDDYLRIGQVKIFADGALGPRTAAMLQPYEGEPDNRGMLFLEAEELFEYGRQAVQNGLSLSVHAIGDLANRVALDAFDHIRAYERGHMAGEHLPGYISLRHRIEHVQLIDQEDASRLANLNIIASMQPIHATSDMQMADRYWGKRSAQSYAWRTLLEDGAILAFGSDAPVDSPNPFWGLHAAVTRCRQDGSPGPDGWYPHQRLTVAEVLRAYTFGPAYAAGLEQRLGKLAPGYLADLLILDNDPFTCRPDKLFGIHPLATMIGGEWIWQV